MKPAAGFLLLVAFTAAQAGVSRLHKAEKLEIRKVEVLTREPASWKRVELRGNRLSFPIPALERDIALKIVRSVGAK